jgi:hypothetical protein
VANALECFSIDCRSRVADNSILKNGVLLAAFDARRPTRNIDFARRALARLFSRQHTRAAPLHTLNSTAKPVSHARQSFASDAVSKKIRAAKSLQTTTPQSLVRVIFSH